MMRKEDLISKGYLQQNSMLHREKKGFGGSGWKHTDRIIMWFNELHCRTALDYGAGRCTLYREIRQRDVKMKLAMYDPAVPRLAAMPRAADFVICTDVLEHVERDKLEAVLRHLCSLMKKGGYFAIATRPANKLLPDGRNAHAIVEDTPFWLEQIEKTEGWTVSDYEDVRKGNGLPHEVRVWLRHA